MLKKNVFLIKDVSMINTFLFLLCFFVSHPNQAQNSEKPNIVFIFADDLGFADLGFTGSDSHLTPHLDKLAKESVYFDNAYSSHPTCLPSRLSLMTGKYPARIGAVSHGKFGGVTSGDNSLPWSEVTIAQALKNGGYYTGHIGKWHIGKGDNNPHTRGFDEDIASNEFCCPGNYFYPFESHQEWQKEMSKVPDLEDHKPGDHLTDALGEEAVKFISKQSNKKPFFLNLSFYAVHTPLAANKEKIEKYKALINENTRQNNAVYAGLVEHLDDAVGNVLKALKEYGFDNNTVVIFTSDNGGEITNNITDNYPLRAGKGSSYEGGIRVPLLVKWPGVTPKGRVSNERIIGLDYYPTLLSISGVKGDANHNKHIDGLNFSGLLKNPNKKLKKRDLHWLKYISLIHLKYPVADRNRCVETVISGDWKLMQFFQMPDNYPGHFELYNLKEDPSETTNLANKFPNMVDKLSKSMRDWEKEVDAPLYDMEKFYGSTQP